MTGVPWRISFALLLFSVNAAAKPLTVEELPDSLKPWVPWALLGTERRLCPFEFSNFEKKYCRWPGALLLSLTSHGGTFSIRWQLDSAAQVPLPGDLAIWPRNVRVNSKDAAVLERNGKPAVTLGRGNYLIDGQFAWTETPKWLVVPREIGAVELKWQSKLVNFPDLDSQGRLWLDNNSRARAKQDNRQDTVSIKVFRKIIDDIPLRIVSRIELNVSGSHREIMLGKFYHEGFLPLSIDSPIPFRLENDGRLRIQVRPGQWVITFIMRSPLQLDSLSLPDFAKPWPNQEIWVFDSRPSLRLVEVDGVPVIDSTQTGLPEKWKSFPSYRVTAGDTMKFRLIRRGDPQPEPNNLTLKKTLWFDFDGSGFTVTDQVTGVMKEGWRLNVARGVQLGQAVVDGKGQLITYSPDTKQAGIEIRTRALSLVADSRIDQNASELDVTGWQEDFQEVRTELNVPPGWRVFSISGVDNRPNTWINRWTLLDLFLVTIIWLAVGKLWKRSWMMLAGVTLVLIWHEPYAPRYIWLNIFAAIALLRVVPPGRLSIFVRYYRNISFLALVFIAIPFLVGQVKVALYPQLELPRNQQYRLDSDVQRDRGSPLEHGAITQAEKTTAQQLPRAVDGITEFSKTPPARITNQIDLDAKIQTGPGLPQWRWKTLRLSWNGPVPMGQKIHMILIPPAINKMLNVTRVICLALLTGLVICGMTGVDPKRMLRNFSTISLLPLMFLLGIGDSQADIPDKTILKELREKLLAPPDCLPVCAQIQLLSLNVSPTTISLKVEVHTDETVAVPIPTLEGSWSPRVLLIDGNPSFSLYRGEKQGLWLKLNNGISTIEYSASLPPTDQIKLLLPLKPHRVRLDSINGWKVEGIDENGRADAQLQLSRIRIDENGESSGQLQARRLPPFFRVERTLQFGLEWGVTTTVVRESGISDAILAKVPSLEGEAVTTSGIRVNDNGVTVNLPPGERSVVWQSVLDKRQGIRLIAAQTNDWSEIWKVSLSPIWHLEYSGIPVVYHQRTTGIWTPEWRPWPGETLKLVLSRPSAVEGELLTIDDSRVQIRPGRRSTESQLDFTLRSSHGARYVIALPPKSTLLSVAIDGKNQPIRLKDWQLTLPIKPGKQLLMVKWREPRGIRMVFQSGEVNLNRNSVNSRINMTVGRDRWVLMMGGPQLGPAVLFWGVLLVIVLISFGLARFSSAPLGFFSWFLLLTGLSQVSLEASFVVVGWLLVLQFRAELTRELSNFRFNLIQTGLIILSLTSFGALVFAVSQGLLGVPSMQVTGNGSSAYNLNWYSDKAGLTLPAVWLLSVPLWIYHLLMLFWALWLAVSLLRWLRWGWGCFSKGGIWRAIEWKKA